MDDQTPTPPSAEFVNLLTEFQPDLWAYTISLMPGHPDVQDVIQKVNVILWKKQEQFEIGTNFRAWVFSIARLEVLAHLRAAKHSRVIPLDTELLDLLAKEATEEVASTPTASERSEALEICMERLKADERALLYHRYATSKPLSDFDGRSSASLSVTLHRIRAAIRKCIQSRLALKGGTA